MSIRLWRPSLEKMICVPSGDHPTLYSCALVLVIWMGALRSDEGATQRSL